MDVKDFIPALNVDFFTGVPDSQLKALCGYLMDTYGIDPEHHIIAANEGSCVGLAAGYHLATGKLPVVYLQNSGEGNIINPVVSLMHQKVYGIPCLFVVGWRGEPGVHDEPQHIYQGEVTLKLLEDMGIPAFVIGPDTASEEIARQMKDWVPWFAEGNQAAFVVRKGALCYDKKVVYQNDFQMVREPGAVRDPGGSGPGAQKGFPHRRVHGSQQQHRPGNRPAKAGEKGLVSGWGWGGIDAYGCHGGDRCKPSSQPGTYHSQQPGP